MFNFTRYVNRSCNPQWDRSDPFIVSGNDAPCKVEVKNECANLSGVPDFWAPNGARDVISQQCGIIIRSEIDSYYRSALAICGRILDLAGLATYNETTKTIYLFNSTACGIRITTTQIPTQIITTAISTAIDMINTTAATIITQSQSESSSTYSDSTESIDTTTITTTTHNEVLAEHSVSSAFFSTPEGIGILAVIIAFCVLVLGSIVYFAKRHRGNVTMERPLPPPPAPTADEVARAMIRINRLDNTLMGQDDDNYELVEMETVDDERDDTETALYDNTGPLAESGLNESSDDTVIYELAGAGHRQEEA